MAPVLNLPSGFAQHTLVWGGTAFPTGAVSTFCTAVPAGVTNPATAASSIASSTTTSGVGWWISGNGWPNAVTLVKVITKFGPVGTGPFGEVSVGTTGGAATDPLPPSVSTLVKKNTNLGGRRGRGFMFLPSFGENILGVGFTIDATTLSTVNGRFATWHSDLISDGFTPVLAHRYDPALGESPLAPTTIQNWTVQALVATQRRRLRR